MPALATRISRAAHDRNLLKIAQMKKKLGSNYAIIGRDKRTSPTTDKRSSTTATQKPHIPPPMKISAILASKDHQPIEIVPGNMKKTLENIRAFEELKLKSSNDSLKKESIRMPKRKTTSDAFVSDSNTKLLLPENSVPPAIIREKEDIISASAKPPFYSYGITPDQAEFLFKKTPMALEKSDISSNAQEQAEIVRRIVSLDNANSKQLKRFNMARVIEMMGRTVHDTGSSEVQACIMTVKIKYLTEHLKNHPKDNKVKRTLQLESSKRVKILKYLRRKNLELFVETCHLIGVDADTIRI